MDNGRSNPKPLVPVDYERCQAEKPNGASFMTFGGRPGLVRCTKRATVVAKESVPSPRDGQVGAMSVCDDCFAVMQKQVPAGSVTYERIKRSKRSKRR